MSISKNQRRAMAIELAGLQTRQAATPTSLVWEKVFMQFVRKMKGQVVKRDGSELRVFFPSAPFIRVLAAHFEDTYFSCMFVFEDPDGKKSMGSDFHPKTLKGDQSQTVIEFDEGMSAFQSDGLGVILKTLRKARQVSVGMEFDQAITVSGVESFLRVMDYGSGGRLKSLRRDGESWTLQIDKMDVTKTDFNSPQRTSPLVNFIQTALNQKYGKGLFYVSYPNSDGIRVTVTPIGRRKMDR